MKLSQFFDSFLDDLARSGRKPSTIHHHRLNIKTVIAPTIGELSLREFRMPHTNLVVERARGNSGPHHSIVTLRRLLRHIKGLGYKLNFDWQDIEVPVYRVKSDVQALGRDEVEDIRRYLLEEKEYSKHSSLFDQAKQRYALARTRALFELLLHTGLRLSEALSVDIADLDFEREELRVRNIKTGEWDTVYLHGCLNPVNEYLKFRQDEHPALFLSNSGTRLCLGTAKSMVRRLKKKIGLKKSLNHKIFRSTFVTTLFRGKCDPKQVQYLARHRSLQTTLNYYYQVEKEKLKPIHKAIMERF